VSQKIDYWQWDGLASYLVLSWTLLLV